MNIAPPEFLQWVTTLGPVGWFIWVWWLERTERKEQIKQKDELLERSINAIHAATTVTKETNTLIDALVRSFDEWKRLQK